MDFRETPRHPGWKLSLKPIYAGKLRPKRGKLHLPGNDGVTGTYLPSTRNPHTGDVSSWEEIFSNSYFNTDDVNLPYVVDM